MKTNKDKKKSQSYGDKIANGLISILLGILGFVLFFLIMLALIRFMTKEHGGPN